MCAGSHSTGLPESIVFLRIPRREGDIMKRLILLSMLAMSVLRVGSGPTRFAAPAHAGFGGYD
jgi:hypothetical protein